MTNEEAIIRLKCLPEFYDVEFETDLTALNMAISALEKQVPKKLVEFPEPKIARVFFGICPNCGEIYNREYPKNFCHKCGQALDWRKENESNISD